MNIKKTEKTAAGRWGRPLLTLIAAGVLCLATALTAEAQASHTRPGGGSSSGTVSGSSSHGSSSQGSSSHGGSPSAGTTRPGSSQGGIVVEKDRRRHTPDYPGYRGRGIRYGGWGGYWGGYYDPWWSPYGWGWWAGWGPWGYPYPGVAWYGRREREDMGALDLDLRPGDTQIFLEGQFIGTADRFDGWPQYLWLEEGTYQLVFYKPGFETLARDYRIFPGVVIDVDDRLARGESTPPEELFAPHPTPRRDARIRRDAEREAAARDDWRRRAEQAPPPPARVGELGSLRLHVEPPDASVYLDGRFVGTGEELARLRGGLALEAGDHVLEVVRPGHLSESRELTVEAGDQLELDIELAPR